MANEQVKIYIAILVDGPVEASAQKLQERLPQISPAGDLHLTLRPAFITSHLQELIDVLTQVCRKISPFEIRVSGCGLFLDKFVYMKVQKSDALQSLHESVMLASQKFVECTKRYVPMGHLEPGQLEMVKMYNFPFCLEYYDPKISIGEAKLDDVDSLRGRLAEIDISANFRVSSMAVVDKLSRRAIARISM